MTEGGAKSILVFKIRGMDCAEEVTLLKREIGSLVGGEAKLSFDILNTKMTVADSSASSDQIIKAVQRTGMQAEPWTDSSKTEPDALSDRRWRTILTAASGALVLAGFLLHAKLAGSILAAVGREGIGIPHQIPLLAKILYALAILAGAWKILPKAWLAARRLRPDMNLLMTVAVIGAVLIGEWFEAATVAFLFALSLALESWSVGRARRAIQALMEMAPSSVRMLESGKTERSVSPEQVAVGSHFLVLPGEKIPLDGRVVQGSSEVNQAPITGESVPAPKHPGTEVFAGTINGNGALEIESTKPAADTTLAHILHQVTEAQSRRAPSEQWVEKFARVYTPSILALAVFVLLVPPLFFHGAWTDWIYRSLVLLVIGCPCALVISTPVSMVAALAGSARNGVLVKGGAYLEAPARLNAIAFDKTGTLTLGQPAVREIVPLDGHSESELLEIAAAMESRSDHPLARAIVKYTQERGLAPFPADNFQIMQGKGASARINGKYFWLGSHRFLEERKQETPEVHRKLESMSQSGQTVVVVGDEQHVCGLIGISDAARPEAQDSLNTLRKGGIDHLVMLTGDNKGTAEAIAAEIGVDEIHSELLPDDKVRVVEDLLSKYKNVAMVGDGINDAPAMARASLGIAMGAAGSDVAIETADIALMSDDLSKLAWLISHSKRTLAIIHQNITLSLMVKALFVALTFLGHASLWSAIAADMGVSLLVILNGLRLL